MRVIKFRAWASNLSEPKMVYDVGLDHLYDGVVAVDLSDYDVSVLSYEKNDIMQFTGLKDKNGKDIYEGDILNSGMGMMVVSWNDKFASFCINKKGWMFSHFFQEGTKPAETEVIGNIYENTELMK